MEQWYSFAYEPVTWELLKNKIAKMFFGEQDGPGDITLHIGSNAQTFLRIRNSSETVANFSIDGVSFELSSAPDRQTAVA